MVEVGVEGKRGYPFPLLYADNKDYVGWERIYSLEKRPASIECTDDEVFSIRYESGEKTVLAIEGKRDGRLAARARGAALSGADQPSFYHHYHRVHHYRSADCVRSIPCFSDDVFKTGPEVEQKYMDGYEAQAGTSA